MNSACEKVEEHHFPGTKRKTSQSRIPYSVSFKNEGEIKDVFRHTDADEVPYQQTSTKWECVCRQEEMLPTEPRMSQGKKSSRAGKQIPFPYYELLFRSNRLTKIKEGSVGV